MRMRNLARKIIMNMMCRTRSWSFLLLTLLVVASPGLIKGRYLLRERRSFLVNRNSNEIEDVR